MAFGAYRRAILEQVGSFDEELVRNQDDELNFRIVQSGGRIWMDPSLVVSYFCRRELRALARQYFSYGYYKVRVVQKRGGISSSRQLVPPLFVVGLITGGLLAVLTRSHAWYLAVGGPYLVADVWSSVLSTGGPDRSNLLVLMATFPIMHVAYGSGFLWGLWRWRRYWRSPGPPRS